MKKKDNIYSRNSLEESLDCEGDLNGDGLVNVADLILFLGYY
ncbi:MAG: hypothetical protein ACJAU0_001399 [Flavobacteriales bacterium]|jgi:hypothetical protein